MVTEIDLSCTGSLNSMWKVRRLHRVMVSVIRFFPEILDPLSSEWNWATVFLLTLYE